MDMTSRAFHPMMKNASNTQFMAITPGPVFINHIKKTDTALISRVTPESNQIIY